MISSPGPVYTGFGRSYGMPDVYITHEDEFKKDTALKRIAAPEEIASLTLFLASNELAGNITGSIFVSDGGYLLK